MMTHVAAWGMALLAGLFLPAALILLIHLQGAEALLALSAPDMAILLAGLFLPPCLLLHIIAWLAQRTELATLGNALLRQTAALGSKRLAAEALSEECRAQTALLQEQVRLTISTLAIGQRQVEAMQVLFTETRLQRLTGEWNLVVADLGAALIAMWRLVHGWKAPGPEAADLPLPSTEELPLRILHLLPPTPQEMAQFEVDERFVRQAARYRATFQAFLERVPETGPLSRDTFRDRVYGRLDARLALLPRPNHARVIDPTTLAAE
jgi:hypothetical protein